MPSPPSMTAVHSPATHFGRCRYCGRVAPLYPGLEGSPHKLMPHTDDQGISCVGRYSSPSEVFPATPGEAVR